MKKSVIAFAAVLVLSLAVSAWGAPAAGNPPQPKIEAAPSVYDLGDISDDVKSKATFTIKNTGDADLVIIDVRPTCGCTVASLSTKQIAPGQKATLEAYYNSHNANGFIKKFINVRSNDPKAENFMLTITANVKPKPAPDISFSAYNLMGLQMGKGGKDMRTIKVISSGQYNLVIDEISATPGISGEFAGVRIIPGQAVKMNVVLKPGETKNMEVVVSPKAQPGYFQEVLTVRSNSGHHPVLTFIAQGMVQ